MASKGGDTTHLSSVNLVRLQIGGVFFDGHATFGRIFLEQVGTRFAALQLALKFVFYFVDAFEEFAGLTLVGEVKASVSFLVI